MARKPAYEPTEVQAGCAWRAIRPALAAQLTGLNFATSAIQPGTRFSDKKAPERKVSGSTRVVDAPISASRCLVSSANQLDTPAMATAIRTDTPINAAMPMAPPGNVAPVAQPI